MRIDRRELEKPDGIDRRGSAYPERPREPAILAGMSYRIVVTEEAKRHLRAVPTRHQRVVLDAMAAQLAHEPSVPTRNRFPMRRDVGPLATWELRVRNFRVFYDIDGEPQPVVRVRAIGEKRGNRLYVGGREVVSYD